MLYSHFTQSCIFLYFLEAKNLCFMTKNCSKSSYICVFILPKKQHNWFYKNLHNSGMVGRRKLPDPSLNCIFNALSIRVQYTLSFQWTNFDLKCLLWITNSHKTLISHKKHTHTGLIILILKLRETSPGCIADLVISRLISNIFQFNY